MRQLPDISLAKSAGKNLDVVIVGLAEGGDTPTIVGAEPTLVKDFQKKFGTDLASFAVDFGGSSKADKTVVLPHPAGGKIVVVGMGLAEPTPKSVRNAAAVGVRTAAGFAKKTPLKVAVSLEADDAEMLQGVAEGALLGAHALLKQTGEEDKAKIASIEIVTPNTAKQAKESLEAARTVATNVCLARDWVNLSPNVLYPESFAEKAKEAAKDVKIAVEIMDDKQLEKEGFGGIMAVGGGSARKPRLVKFSYAPKGATFHLGLVGKGVTFDSGGLDIKPADGMYDMRCDMGGAATVLAATRAIAELGLKIKVTTYASMAENMPSGEAYRPSDVLTMYGGKTVENANTDAEGRLVMADALTKLNADGPDLVVDCATLTGACMIALGDRIAGLMASDDETADLVLDAAEKAGEEFWQLPMTDHLRESLKSDVADIKSTGNRMGGAMAAACFLHKFVDEDLPYAHLDIAGPALSKESYGCVGKGGSGHGVRTLVALAQHLQK